MTAQDIYTLWETDRRCAAYDAACELARRGRGMIGTHHIENGAMDLRAIVVGACRAAVRSNDRGWLEERMASGAIPPTRDARDDEEHQVLFAGNRRLVVIAHLAAALLALESLAINAHVLVLGRDGPIDGALAALGTITAGDDNDVGPAGDRLVIPFGLMRDLAFYLASEDGRTYPGEAAGRSRGLLVDVARETRDRKGRLASVECALVSGGTATVYAHPDQAFTMRDKDFLEAERNAYEFVKPFLPDGDRFDLRWRVTVDGEQQPPRRLNGPSCGAALALAAARAAAHLNRR